MNRTDLSERAFEGQEIFTNSNIAHGDLYEVTSKGYGPRDRLVLTEDRGVALEIANKAADDIREGNLDAMTVFLTVSTQEDDGEMDAFMEGMCSLVIME
jgi:hypothetical protein